MSGETIIRRWARRKAEARVVRPAPEPPELEAPTDDAFDPDLTAQTGEAAIAALTGESDITVFLKKGVAGWAKNAALRRVWAMDPAIRDFVGEARDYGYDWNSGEGVPGFGPILASDNATSILNTMFSDVSLMKDKVMGDEGEEARGTLLEPPLPTSAGDALAARRAGDAAAAELPCDMVDPEPAPVVAQDVPLREPGCQTQPEVAEDPKPRRHGSAMPV